MTALLIAAVVAAYLFGGAFSGEVFGTWGERNPRTIGDSWTGDNSLDLLTVVLWPISWVLVAGVATAKRLVRARVGNG